MGLMMLPLFALYVLSLVFAYFGRRGRMKSESDGEVIEKQKKTKPKKIRKKGSKIDEPNKE